MKVLTHHIYEYKKGLRSLVLHTLCAEHRDKAEARLSADNIDYVTHVVGSSKINIFFGAAECVNIIREFGHRKLNEFTPEEDFILGIMLGYCRRTQCERYLTMKNKKNRAA
jgi:hypothetical protein